MVEQPKITRGADRKAELLRELEWSRAELARNYRRTRNDLDVVAHVKESIVHKKTAWFAGAAITGWILSRLPRRRKSEAAPKELHKKGRFKEVERTGLLLTVLGFLFNLLKPALTRLATQKITEMSTRNNLGWRRPSR